MTRYRESPANLGPVTEAEKAMREAALGQWLGMGAADPVGDLRHLAQSRMYLDRAITREVAALRKRRRTWAVIGDALGINRSAAQQRYADL